MPNGESDAVHPITQNKYTKEERSILLITQLITLRERCSRILITTYANQELSSGNTGTAQIHLTGIALVSKLLTALNTLFYFNHVSTLQFNTTVYFSSSDDAYTVIFGYIHVCASQLTSRETN